MERKPSFCARSALLEVRCLSEGEQYFIVPQEPVRQQSRTA
jgi:hypothetical protein